MILGFLTGTTELMMALFIEVRETGKQEKNELHLGHGALEKSVGYMGLELREKYDLTL